MKLREYIAHLQDIVDSKPEALDYDVVYYEGGYHDELWPVENAPAMGLCSSHDAQDFDTESGFPNAVCVN